LQHHPPFAFAPREDARRRWYDEANGLVIATHQWPEYENSVSLSPLHGPQAEAWPLRARAYFEFNVRYRRMDDGHDVARLGFAMAHQPFERDYPGRTDELLDMLLPLVPRIFAVTWPLQQAQFLPAPERLRPLLLGTGSYFPHRDEPSGDEWA